MNSGFYCYHYMSRVTRKPDFRICVNKDADQLRGITAKLISAFVFATRIVQSLYFLNPKFQASSHLLWLYSLVCVRPGRKPRRPVFSERGSYILGLFQKCGHLLMGRHYLSTLLPMISILLLPCRLQVLFS